MNSINHKIIKLIYRYIINSNYRYLILIIEYLKIDNLIARSIILSNYLIDILIN